jgi:DNA-binding beta-propeller fold protein YncE
MRYLVLVAGIMLAADASAASLVFVRASEPVFAEPHDLVVDRDGKRLYVADMMNNTVKIIDASTLAVVGEFGKDELSLPHDVTFDRQGKLLVADTGNDRIAIYEIGAGGANRVGDLHDGVSGPEGVDVDDDGRVYVTNTGEHTVVVLEHGRRIKQAGGNGHRPGEFVQPHDIAIGPDGKVYVGDPGNNRIQVLRGDLSVEAQIVGDGQPFNRPKYLGFDERGRLYVADQYNSMVRVLDEKRKQIAVITEAGGKKLDRIEGVYVRGARVWIADTYNNRIVLFKWQ